jgi:hypothetical protein
MDNDWSSSIELVLENIRKNCLELERIHKQLYFNMKNKLKWYKLPIIIISGANSVIAVSLQVWIPQEIISMTNCLLALLCGLISSVELYLQIQKRMEVHLISSKEYYVLASDICKVLLLDRSIRPLPADVYLHNTYNNYIKYYEASVLLNNKITDNLLPIDILQQKTIIDLVQIN